MAQADWTELKGSIDPLVLRREIVTSSVVAMPSLAADHAIGFNSGANFVHGVSALASASTFASAGHGAQITGVVQRGVSGGASGWSAFLFAQAGGPDVADSAYMLGLADGNPSRIVLAKRPIGLGLADSPPGTNGVLRRSAIDFANIGDWVHLKLEAIVEPNGDVLLRAKKNNVLAHGVNSPVWDDILGMDDFVDDNLAVNSRSNPLTSGLMGFGTRMDDVQRRTYFYWITTAAQP